MRVYQMLDHAETLLKIYEEYTRKVMSKIKDPYFILLILLFYRIVDLLQLLEAMRNSKDLYYEALSKGYLNEAFQIYRKILRFYLEYEVKIVERILSLVKIYALYLTKEYKNIS